MQFALTDSEDDALSGWMLGRDKKNRRCREMASPFLQGLTHPHAASRQISRNAPVRHVPTSEVVEVLFPRFLALFFHAISLRTSFRATLRSLPNSQCIFLAIFLDTVAFTSELPAVRIGNAAADASFLFRRKCSSCKHEISRVFRVPPTSEIVHSSDESTTCSQLFAKCRRVEAVMSNFSSFCHVPRFITLRHQMWLALAV